MHEIYCFKIYLEGLQVLYKHHFQSSYHSNHSCSFWLASLEIIGLLDFKLFPSSLVVLELFSMLFNRIPEQLRGPELDFKWLPSFSTFIYSFGRLKDNSLRFNYMDLAVPVFLEWVWEPQLQRVSPSCHTIETSLF